MKGQTALITGASSGFGAAIAECFAKQGATLVLCARREDRLASLRAHLEEQYSAKVFTIKLDVRESDAVEAFRTLPAPFEKISIVVNNAGLAAGRDALEGASIADIDAMIDTNVKGLLYVTRAVLPTLKAQGRGHIVNIGSIAGHETYAGGATYCASKFAVRAITSALRQEVLGTGIRVTAVDPGLAETEFSLVRFKGDAKQAKDVYAGVHALSAQDVAEAVSWAVNRPAHVSIEELVICATDQAGARLVHRRQG